MKLLPESVRRLLPPLYSTEQTDPDDTRLLVKFFHPASGWTWLAAKGEPTDQGADYLFFGLVIGQATEWGYFALSELADPAIRPAIERDLYFSPVTAGELLAVRAQLLERRRVA